MLNLFVDYWEGFHTEDSELKWFYRFYVAASSLNVESE